MRRYFDLVVAGSSLFLCLFVALILQSVSVSSDSGFLTMFTWFLALVFGVLSGIFQLVFAGIRLIFKLDPRRFWARATLVALAVTIFSLLYSFLANNAEIGLLTLALGIFTLLAALQFGCAQALAKCRSPRNRKSQCPGEQKNQKSSAKIIKAKK